MDLLPTGEFQYSVSRGQKDRWKCKMTILVELVNFNVLTGKRDDGMLNI